MKDVRVIKNMETAQGMSTTGITMILSHIEVQGAMMTK